MATSLIDIASDLAANYPLAPQQQIIETIIDSIESEPIISQAISYLLIPTKLQIKKAEFQSKRHPKEQSRILEHINNAKFFKKLQSLYVLPVPNSDLTPIIGLDGARVDFYFSTKDIATSYQVLPLPRLTGLDGTQPRATLQPVDTPATHSHSSTALEPPVRNSKEVEVSSSAIIAGVETTSSQGSFLSFYNIYQVINIMQLYPEDSSTLIRISKVIRNDMNLRNRVFKSDCLRELYRGDDLLPKEIRLTRPKISDAVANIYDGIRAIILNEYQRLHNQSGQEFINGKISYDTYVQNTTKYAASADKLMSALT